LKNRRTGPGHTPAPGNPPRGELPPNSHRQRLPASLGRASPLGRRSAPAGHPPQPPSRATQGSPPRESPLEGSRRVSAVRSPVGDGAASPACHRTQVTGRRSRDAGHGESALGNAALGNLALGNSARRGFTMWGACQPVKGRDPATLPPSPGRLCQPPPDRPEPQSLARSPAPHWAPRDGAVPYSSKVVFPRSR
jgi:hypothetical protein